MATNNRKPKALLDAEKEIERLTKELANTTATKDMWYKQNQENTAVIDGIHEVLTDMGIREYKDETQRYNRLPIAVRLFSWAMSLANKK